MSIKKRQVPLFFAAAALMVLLLQTCTWGEDNTQAAQVTQAAIRAGGVRAGFCVCLGADDGLLTAGLGADPHFLVHGLAGDEASCERARKHLDMLGIYGRVSVECGSFKRLPYADDLVNLVVVRDLPALSARGLALREVVRILAPRGSACLGRTNAAAVAAALKTAGCTDIEIAERDGWTVCRKKFPADMDEWTHGHYSPDGNAVSRDTIGVPRTLRWQAGPQYQAGRHYFGGGRPVSAGGRLFTVTLEDEDTAQGRIHRQVLWCRDAHNGLLLWKCDATVARPDLVVTGERVYAVLKVKGPLLALDAASGKPVQTYKEAQYPDDWLLYKDRLIVRMAPPKGAAEILCLDAAAGTVRWRKEIKAQDLLVAEEQVFCLTAHRKEPGELVCIDAGSGTDTWRSTDGVPPGTLLFHYDGVLIFGSGVKRRAQVHGVSARDGKLLWSFKYKLISHGGRPSKVFGINGCIWVNRYLPDMGWVGLDPKTGEVRKFLKEAASCWSRNLCADNRATKRFLLSRTMLFTDVQTGEYHRPWGIKNACSRASILPANGLIYTFPHQCLCYSMLRGVLGLSSRPPILPETERPAGKLEKGPAYGENKIVKPSASNEEAWAFYRADKERSGSTTSAVPADAELLWEANLGVFAGTPTDPAARLWAVEWAWRGGGQISSPTIAAGKVFVAQTDRHRVLALDAKTGDRLWSYTAGGRVDTPPTLYGEWCLFGSNDGWIYCLKIPDGRLAWRLRVAPAERKIVSFGQLESAWPVHGSVLVQNGRVYAAAGRHSKFDGGVFLFALNPANGSIRWSKQPQDYHGLAGLLAANGKRGICFASQHYSQGTSFFRSVNGKMYGRMEKAEGSLSSNTGLLSEMWLGNLGTRARSLSLWSYYGLRAQKMVFDEKAVYGFHLGDRKKNSRLSRQDCYTIADGRNSKPAWTVEFPKADRKMSLRYVHAMALAGNTLWVAGRIGRERDSGVLLRGYSADKGQLLREVKLTAAGSLSARPVNDGMAAADGRLYVSCTDGRLLCFGKH